MCIRDRLSLAAWIEDRAERADQLAWIAERFTDSPYRDEVRLERAQRVAELDPEAAVGLLEGLLTESAGALHLDALRALVDLLLELDRPSEALARIEAAGPPEILWHSQAVEALRSLGRLEEAQERCERWVAEATAEGIGAPARWALAQVLQDRGRAAEALALYDELREDGRPGPWRGAEGRRRWLQALALVHSGPLLAGLLHLFLWSLAIALSVVAFAGRFRRALRFLPAAAVLCSVATAAQLASLFLREGGPDAAGGAYVVYATLRNVLLATAGCVLLPAVGVKHGPWLRLLGPRPAAAPIGAALLRIAAALALMAGLSYALFRTVEPRPGPFFERMASLARDSEFSLLADASARPLEACAYAASAAVQEELVYRFVLLAILLHGLRRVLARRAARATAVVLTALAWAAVHAGMVEPEWAKLLQVSLLGCVLGWLALAQGAGSAVVAHVVFNLTAILLVRP